MSSSIKKKVFGHLPDGRQVDLFELSNGAGLTAKVTSYGGILTELWLQGQGAKPVNLVAGFERLEDYLKGHPFFGATTGRVANRIAGARFTLDERNYTLAANDGRNHLHGGLAGFDKMLWKIQEEGNSLFSPLSPVHSPRSSDQAAAAVELAYLCADGEEGYPGNLSVLVRYSVTPSNELRIDYQAETDQPTLLNLTNHSYFNLAGTGEILDHQLEISAGKFTVVDRELIPTGEVNSVEGTPLDFRKSRRIGDRIEELKPIPGGYDHNFVLSNAPEPLRKVARALDPSSGRWMEVLTTEPGIQLYTGNFLDGTLKGAGGRVFTRHSCFCLETQHWPDAIHHPNFPSIVLAPGRKFRSTTVYRFGD